MTGELETDTQARLDDEAIATNVHLEPVTNNGATLRTPREEANQTRPDPQNNHRNKHYNTGCGEDDAARTPTRYHLLSENQI